jgi:integrase/recombinase XerD
MSQAKSLTEKELQRLLAYLKSTKNPRRNRAMVLLTYYAGLRVQEVAKLTIGCVYEQSGDIKREIHLQPDQTKGNHPRVILLSEKLVYELKDYLEIRLKQTADRSQPLFTPESSSKAFSVDSLTHRFHDFYRKAGFDNASSHSGRRTFITQLASKGVSARVLQELAGHRHLTTTQRYIDISEAMKRNAVELI